MKWKTGFPMNQTVNYTMLQVKFDNEGTTLTGHLYLPLDLSRPVPAVPLLGPMTFVKEQAPSEYARRLAEQGFAALAFDPRYHGQSKGNPRRWENPMSKVSDVRAAIDYLQSRPEVDANRIAAMAVCQGSSAMVRAAADDSRIQALATVAGHYRDHQADLEWLGEAGLAERLAKGNAAKAKFEKSGEVDYVPAVDPTRTDVGMPGDFVWNWYKVWAEKGIWENRYAVMSDAALLQYESASAMKRLHAPYLMIHSENCFLPDSARRHFEMVPGLQKQLLWENPNAHFQYYDDAEVLDTTTRKIASWFTQHLG